MVVLGRWLTDTLALSIQNCRTNTEHPSSAKSQTLNVACNFKEWSSFCSFRTWPDLDRVTHLRQSCHSTRDLCLESSTRRSTFKHLQLTYKDLQSLIFKVVSNQVFLSSSLIPTRTSLNQTNFEWYEDVGKNA